MSSREIIDELPKLSRAELEQVSRKVVELLAPLAAAGNSSRALKRFAGAVRGLPEDMARNHDFYLHGRPKK